MKTFYTFSLVVILATTLACGYGSKNYKNAYGNTSVPAISQLSPDNMNAGGAAFALTVNGNNFTSKAVVNWNGVAQSTTYITGNQLMIAVPAAMIAAPATVQISVTNPAIGGKGPYGMGGALAMTSQSMNFTVN